MSSSCTIRISFPHQTMCYCGSLVKFVFACVCIASLAKTDNESAALGYFITPCAATLLTLFCYLVLPHLVRSFITAFLVHKKGGML